VCVASPNPLSKQEMSNPALAYQTKSPQMNRKGPRHSALFVSSFTTTIVKFLPGHIAFFLILSLKRKILLLASSSNNPQCDLFLAESTIPGAGLGIFSGVTKHAGDSVGNGDVCIPFLNIYWHNDNEFFFPMSDYVWDGNFMGMQMEGKEDDINAYWPGLDCAVNCHLALLNVEKATPKYDEGGLHRGIHPGAGAISPYHNGTTLVSRTIPEGGELFKNYGDRWYVSSYRLD
jgi:hypothetical protein